VPCSRCSRAKCTYEVQRGAIATTRHALKLPASRCFGGRRTRRGNELRRPYVHRAGASSARVARNSFSLVRCVVSFPSPRARARDSEFSRSLGEPNSCSRFDMSLALPARFALSFAYSAIYPRLFLSLPSPSDSRVYSRALAAFLRRPGTRLIFLEERFSCTLRPRSEREKSKTRRLSA